MGTPSDRRRSARRLGKAERARRKKHRRGRTHLFRSDDVGGAQTFELRAGRKKWIEAARSRNPRNPWSVNPRPINDGEPIPKVGDGDRTAALHDAVRSGSASGGRS